MFGYVVADASRLEPEQSARYRASYCGLCRSLKLRHGQLSRFALTYDMTFLSLLLDSLYEPDLSTGESHCMVHPLHKQAWRTSRWSEYAADLNVALAYYNCMDDWVDDRALEKLAYAQGLRSAYQQVQQALPQQCRVIEETLRELSALEQANSADLDRVSRCFGRLMGTLFAVGDPFWRDTLYQVGDYLGRFIYVMDAVLDEPDDQRTGSYNPVSLFRAEQGGFDALSTLTLLIGSCVSAYETLPLVQDKDLLDNILYHGVWAKWAARHSKDQNPPQEESTQ
jgi:hypothetical protein